MLEVFTEFFEKHQGALLTVFFGLVGFLFLRWEKSRRASLSKRAKKLLKRLKADATHDVKGISLHHYDGMVNYWPFRILDREKVELGMLYQLTGEYLEAVQSVEEMLAKNYLTLEYESEGGLTVYRLKEL